MLRDKRYLHWELWELEQWAASLQSLIDSYRNSRTVTGIRRHRRYTADLQDVQEAITIVREVTQLSLW